MEMFDKLEDIVNRYEDITAELSILMLLMIRTDSESL